MDNNQIYLVVKYPYDDYEAFTSLENANNYVRNYFWNHFDEYYPADRFKFDPEHTISQLKDQINELNGEYAYLSGKMYVTSVNLH